MLNPAEIDKLDRHWMSQALEIAKCASQTSDIPVGAVIVSNDCIIGRACNEIEAIQDPTAHAEIMAIRDAAKSTGSKWLEKAVMYVTLEPCAMCAGGIVLARLARVVFGAYDAKAGACGSLRDVVRDCRLNHVCDVQGGVLQDDCSDLITGFFAQLRRNS